jgi:hypothetical protein
MIRIPKPDIDNCILEVKCSPETERHQILQKFLKEKLFDSYREEDYSVELTGALKPSYRGHVQHLIPLGDGLIDQLARNVEDLGVLKQILEASVPLFAAPVYIGVAKESLRKRLATHRNLLEQYRERVGMRDDDDATLSDQGHSFAYNAMVLRGWRPTDMVAYVMEMPSAGEMALPTENILNRINYPLCGRN